MNEPVLIVDDNLLNLTLTRTLLRQEGFEVRTAEDAAEAVTVLAKFRPEVILMDIQLPGIDGLELTRRLKAEPSTRGIPIIAVTAYAMRSDEERARQAGCDGFITKPVNTKTLAGTIRRILAATRQPPEPE